MAIGMYPIPPPDARTLEIILGDNQGDNASNQIEEPKPMAIFELLDYIVNAPPPRLEHRAFSPEFKNFIDICLVKNPHERGDLVSLTVSIRNMSVDKGLLVDGELLIEFPCSRNILGSISISMRKSILLTGYAEQ